MKQERTIMTVNIDQSDLTMVDQMTSEDALFSRSSFIRRLIRQEWERRHQPVRLVSDAVGIDQDVNSLSE